MQALTSPSSLTISFKFIYDKLDFLTTQFEVKRFYISYKSHFYDAKNLFGFNAMALLLRNMAYFLELYFIVIHNKN